MHACIAGFGAIAVVCAGPIISWFDRHLPLAVTVRSSGTILGSLGSIGDEVLRRTGIALLAAACLSAAVNVIDVGPALSSARRISRVFAAAPRHLRNAIRAIALFAVPYIVVHWLSTPPQLFSTNARIHWVDYFVEGPRQHSFFYAAGQLPHALFNMHPTVWQGINAGLLALALDLVLRRLSFGRVASFVLSLAFLGGSMAMLFVGVGEDVFINYLLLVVLLGACTTRRPVVRGLALALCVTGRPEFVSLLLAYAVAAGYDLWLERRNAANPVRLASPALTLHARSFAWALAGIAACQVVFTILGDRYMFTNGKLIELGQLAHLVPIDVDGFLIAPFSGAYGGHFLWLAPLGFLAALVASVPRLLRVRRRTDGPTGRRIFVVAACLAATTVTVLLHEMKPTRTFCVRYLSYTYPFLFIGGAVVVELIRRSRPKAGVLLWSICIFTLVSVPVHPIEDRDSAERRAETALLDRVGELRNLHAGRDIYVAYGGQSTKNIYSYLFFVDQHEIKVTAPRLVPQLVQQLDSPAILVAKRGDFPRIEASADILLTTDELEVLLIKG